MAIESNRKGIRLSKASDRRISGGIRPSPFLHDVPKNVNSSKLNPLTKGQSNNYHTKTVIRESGGKKWEDPSLLEWDPKHFRLFVGNLGPDANDELLHRAFERYKTLTKVKVPTDNRSGKNKGYGFIAFSDADDYLKAFKEMDGKYVGQHPVQLKRAETALYPKKIKADGNRHEKAKSIGKY